MKKLKYIFTVLLITTLISSCFPDDFKENANKTFGDQHFKTAIALIELHKLREGEYPEKLKDLKYTGTWDNIIYRSVRYTKLENGYELDLIKGWSGKPDNLKYPKQFWNGLGLVKSNLKLQDSVLHK